MVNSSSEASVATEKKRYAGILIPLFSLRTADDWGRGDIGGLLPMGDFARAMGHRLIQILPINETAPDETSPYSAMSVMALDPIYLSAPAIPGVGAAAYAEARHRAVAAENGAIDQNRVRSMKLYLVSESHRAAFTVGGDRSLQAAYNDFTAENRDWLDDYTLFRALRGKLGWTPWMTWPEGLRQRDATTLAAARRELAREIAHHSYAQFLTFRQWRKARTRLAQNGVMLGGDLAFSPCHESAEVWAHQDLFDPERWVGAPPDAFSATGQRWALPMPNWEQMRADGFAFIRRRVRAARALYDLLRIDHVVGLFRTYGYRLDEEAGAFDPPTEEAQQVHGLAVLKAILAEAGAMQIVAEDLGLIPPFVRRTLKALSIPGYKVMRWEKQDWGTARERFVAPADYPELALATTGTHDTETFSEWWKAAPLAERRSLAAALGIAIDGETQRATMDDATLDAILTALYNSPARMVVVPIQDLFGWSGRINTPGTIGPANWTWRLPAPIAKLDADPAIRMRLARLRQIVQHSRRGPD
jgi:4-alpha-glucanotransferase